MNKANVILQSQNEMCVGCNKKIRRGETIKIEDGIMVMHGGCNLNQPDGTLSLYWDPFKLKDVPDVIQDQITDWCWDYEVKWDEERTIEWHFNQGLKK